MGVWAVTKACVGLPKTWGIYIQIIHVPQQTWILLKIIYIHRIHGYRIILYIYIIYLFGQIHGYHETVGQWNES